ncbi:MAG: T9SS type A sorting domain-containing protein [Bacteroidota bacterium]
MSSYEVRISARKKNAAADLFIEFEGNVIPLGCQISSNNWQDYPAFCNGNPIIITPSSMEKEHEVKVYAANGEVHLDYITIVPVSGSNRTAIQVEEKLDMSIYPNPANSKALLKVKADQSSSAELRILNLNGQTISVRSLELQAGEQEFAIPVSELANGMYMIQLKTENVTLSEKLQILH